MEHLKQLFFVRLLVATLYPVWLWNLEVKNNCNLVVDRSQAAVQLHPCPFERASCSMGRCSFFRGRFKSHPIVAAETSSASILHHALMHSCLHSTPFRSIGAASEDPSAKGASKPSKPSKVKGRRGEKFNEHFRALAGLHNASNNQMLKQSCNQLPDAITRSRIFCDHLSQCAMVVGVLQGLRNARERAMYSNTVPWPMHFGQWPHSLRNHFI